MGFGSDLLKASQTIMVQTNEQARKVVTTLGTAIIDDTPVKSGRLKGGWRSSFGAPITSETVRLDPSGESAKAELRVIARSLPAHKDWNFYFSNMTPYGVRIEYLGWSLQAPHGMVRLNVAKLPALIRQALAQGGL